MGVEVIAGGLPGDAAGVAGAGLLGKGIADLGEGTTDVPAGGGGEPAGPAGVVLPVAVEVGTGSTGDAEGLAGANGEAGTTVLKGGLNPGHLPQVICSTTASQHQHNNQSATNRQLPCTYLTVPKRQSWCWICDESSVAFAKCFLQHSTELSLDPKR